MHPVRAERGHTATQKAMVMGFFYAILLCTGDRTPGGRHTHVHTLTPHQLTYPTHQRRPSTTACRNMALGLDLERHFLALQDEPSLPQRAGPGWFSRGKPVRKTRLSQHLDFLPQEVTDPENAHFFCFS